MKAMTLTWEFPPFITGGLGQHVKELLPALRALEPGLEQHVVAPAFDETIPPVAVEGITVHWTRAQRPRPEHFFEDVLVANHALAETASRVAQEYGPFDLVHVHDWLPAWAAYAVQELDGAPLVATIHATERGRYRGNIYDHMSASIDGAEGELCRRADRIITCSRAMQHEVERFFAIPAAKITVIPNGIDGRRFDALRALDLTEFRARYASPQEKLVFNVGRLVFEKGADLLIEAASQVLPHAPTTRFVIAGQGPLMANLSHRVEALHLGSRVTLTGFLADEDRDRLYMVADCCVFPSRYEPFGIVALEAMAAGSPVVVADVGGLGSVVTHEKTGLTALPDNVGSLAAAILRTLQDTPAAVERAANARQQVEECMAWAVIAGLTLRVYAQAARVAAK